jgi:hypothetical protein
MKGVTVSFLADPEIAAKVKEAARIDGVSQSQGTARAVASGVLLSAGGAPDSEVHDRGGRG